MTYPIRVTVRHKYQSYSCRFPNGMSASSTNSAEAAVQRLAAESIARRCAGERPISNAQGAEANIETIRRTA